MPEIFWLDPDDLDVDAYEAECFRASRPDRAQFIRRLIATWRHGKMRTDGTYPVLRNNRCSHSEDLVTLAVPANQHLLIVIEHHEQIRSY
jgi:hypothetical protein